MPSIIGATNDIHNSFIRSSFLFSTYKKLTVLEVMVSCFLHVVCYTYYIKEEPPNKINSVSYLGFFFYLINLVNKYTKTHKTIRITMVIIFCSIGLTPFLGGPLLDFYVLSNGRKFSLHLINRREK